MRRRGLSGKVMSYEIIEITDLNWGFDAGEPSVRLNVGTYGRSEKVDPHPCYAHKPELLDKMLAKVTSDFPMQPKLKLFNIHFEGLGRTNAWASYEVDYDDEDRPRKFLPYISVLGKRIPPHPAMTRYLVAHEYGHCVENWIAYCRGIEDLSLRKEYKELRNMQEEIPYYGGRTWHKSVGEVLANDFRILVCGVEPEYWVHDVPFPTEVPEVVAWWQDALQYKFLDKQE
jgi:hypothetical protein